MTMLIVLSVPFAAIAFLVRRPWTVALPFAVWLGVAALSTMGVITGDTTPGSAILAGVVGAAFALAGLVLGERNARQQPRP